LDSTISQSAGGSTPAKNRSSDDLLSEGHAADAVSTSSDAVQPARLDRPSMISDDRTDPTVNDRLVRYIPDVRDARPSDRLLEY